jgi:glycosyltransferase involved in cell wall biosynthesis
MAMGKSETDYQRPALAIVMPCFNTPPKLIEHAIQSVIEERSRLQEKNVSVSLTIVDDASTDPGTLACIKQHLAQSNWIDALFLTENHGPAGSRNQALISSTAQWISFLDSDDYWLPGAISSLWDEVCKDPSIQWISGDLYIQHAGREVESQSYYPQHPKMYSYISEAYSTSSLIRLQNPVDIFMEGNLCSMGSCIISNSLLREIGYFDSSLKKGVDTELYWRLAKAADLFFYPIPVFVYRRYPGTVSHDGKNLFDWEPPVLRQMLNDVSWKPYRNSVKRRLLRTLINISSTAGKTGNYKRSLKYSCQAVKLKPQGMQTWLALIKAATVYFRNMLGASDVLS